MGISTVIIKKIKILQMGIEFLKERIVEEERKKTTIGAHTHTHSNTCTQEVNK
jgi:hypothetical protein